jgi:hypothetical protein
MVFSFMYNPKMATSHARKLGIFAWIYVVILVISVLLNADFVITFFGEMLKMGPSAFWDDLVHDLSSPYGLMFIVFLVFVISAALIIIASIAANIRLGLRLRRVPTPTRRSVVISSILSLISSFFGGLFAVPFGTALCIYGLWFAFRSKEGR